jgi:hypothetical protein
LKIFGTITTFIKNGQRKAAEMGRNKDLISAMESFLKQLKKIDLNKLDDKRRKEVDEFIRTFSVRVEQLKAEN